MDTKKEELMTILVDSLKGIKDFTLEQAPDVLQQWLGMEMLHCAAVIFAMLLTLAVSIVSFKYSWAWYKKVKDKPGNEDEVPFLLGFCSFAGIVASLVFMIINGTTLLQIYLFPKAYLLKSLL